MTITTTMLQDAWSALHGSPERPRTLVVAGGEGPDATAAPLSGPLATGELASATAGAALLAAAELAEARTGSLPSVTVDPAHVAVAFTSERYVQLDGRPPAGVMDPLSAFFATADGWIRLHANYPHHRAALMRALGHPRDGRDGVAAAVLARSGEDLESAIVAAGGAAAAVRDAMTWGRTPQGAAVNGRRLLDFEPGLANDANALAPLPAGADPAKPAAGLKVLDLTRVIAGPVGTRTLAALGAEVLRIDAPLSAELPLQWLDTGPGKRSAHLQLRNRLDRERLHRLLDDTDVLVTGYRPGALDPFGLSRDVLEEKHPHLCTVTLSAWGENGPWRGRRGFDSLVQAATGISIACSPDGGESPGVLPAQALDHGTGHLVAAAALRALALRARDRRPSHARVALARTAMWLLDQPRTAVEVDVPASDAYLTTVPSPLGEVTVVRPPGAIGGTPLGWTAGPGVPGADPPYWL